MWEATFDSMRDTSSQLRFAGCITRKLTNIHQFQEIGLISIAFMLSCAGIQVPWLVKALILDRGEHFHAKALFVPVSQLTFPTEKLRTNGKLFNWLLKRWKASFWRNELKAKKLI
jgi:hypothetical protein